MLNISTTYINSHQEILPNLMSPASALTIQDMLSFYFPNGPIRKTVAYYGGAGISQILSTNSVFYDVNYMLRDMMKIPSLDTNIDSSMVAGGKGYSIPSSFLGALGESVERFSGVLKTFSDSCVVEYGSYREMTKQGFPCLAPSEMPLFTEEQYKDPNCLFVPFTEDARIGWVEGRRLISEEPIWLPAQLALFFYFRSPGEAPIAYSASSGMACHIDEETAIYGGITELIERDKLALTWYCKIPPKRIVVDRPLNDTHVQRFMYGLHALPGKFNLFLHDLDMPEFPVVSAMTRTPHTRQLSYFAGAAAGFDVDEALIQGLVEYGQSEAQIKLATSAPERVWSMGADMFFDVDVDKPAEEMTTFLENLGYYGHPKNGQRLEWFMNEGGEVRLSELPPPKRFADSKARLEAVKEVLARYHIDPILVDNTAPHMKQLKVIKVFIPELVQPHVGAHPFLGHPRLYNLPRQLGLRETALKHGELQPGPTPFP